MAVVDIVYNLIFSHTWLMTSSTTLWVKGQPPETYLLLSHSKQLQKNGFHPQMMKIPLWRGDRKERKLGNSVCLFQTAQYFIRVFSDRRLWFLTRNWVYWTILPVFFWSPYSHQKPGVFFLCPDYSSRTLQHIWQGKTAVPCILFLLFKVYIPAKWIISEPKTGRNSLLQIHSHLENRRFENL